MNEKKPIHVIYINGEWRQLVDLTIKYLVKKRGWKLVYQKKRLPLKFPPQSIGKTLTCFTIYSYACINSYTGVMWNEQLKTVQKSIKPILANEL